MQTTSPPSPSLTSHSKKYLWEKISRTASSNSKMESSTLPTIAKRLWHIGTEVYYMLRNGIPKRKLLLLDLHLLIKRGKLAGKALSHFITFHYRQSVAVKSDRHFYAFMCRSLDSNMPFYDPKGVEFSCSNTPYYNSYYSKTSTMWKSHRQHHEKYVAVAAKVMEILNTEVSDVESVISSSFPTPSPMLGLAEGSPTVRQLRITDSPFPIHDEEIVDANKIDKEAEEFIRRFYEQLERQQLASAMATQVCKLRTSARISRA